MIRETPFEHHYSHDIHNTTVALLGIYPPPIGGVSVHIQRVMDRLGQQHNKVYFFDTEQPLRRKWFTGYLFSLAAFLFKKRPHEVHYHSNYLRSSFADLFVIIFLKKLLKYRVAIIEHDCRHLYRRSRLFKKFYCWILSKTDQLVLIGTSTQKSYEENNITFPNVSSVEGAFLPPVAYNISCIMERYPSSLFTFLKDFTPIILVNASHLMLIKGADVYGLDLCIDMMVSIKNRYPDAGLLIVLARMNNADYFHELQRHMKNKGVAENVYVVQDDQELWPLFKYVDVFIRPTRSDGASVSLQEALHFNVPSIASDVCKRPPGAITHGTGDALDLAHKVNELLQNCIYGANQREHRNFSN